MKKLAILALTLAASTVAMAEAHPFQFNSSPDGPFKGLRIGILGNEVESGSEGINWSILESVEFKGDFKGANVPFLAISKFKGDLNGFSGSIANFHEGDIKGFVGGIYNEVDTISAGGIGGLVNIVEGDAENGSVGGFYNNIKGDVFIAGGAINLIEGNAFMASGLYNRVAGDATFAGGFFNDIKGHNVASGGLVNLADSAVFQLGIYNRAERLEGIQIGLINSAGNGLTVPFVNFKKSM